MDYFLLIHWTCIELELLNVIDETSEFLHLLLCDVILIWINLDLDCIWRSYPEVDRQLSGNYCGHVSANTETMKSWSRHGIKHVY